MAAVAVLRNDSLQAFLQVRAGLEGGEGKVGRGRVSVSPGTLCTLNLKRTTTRWMLQESDLEGPTPTSHLTLVSRVWTLGEGSMDPGVVPGVRLAENKARAHPAGPSC